MLRQVWDPLCFLPRYKKVSESDLMCSSTVFCFLLHLDYYILVQN